MFNKHILYSFLFFLLAVSGFSKTNDEKEKLNKKIAADKEDSVKVLDMIELAGHYYMAFDFKKAMEIDQEVFTLSQKLKFNHGIISSLNAIADIYWYKSNLDKAFNYYYKAYRISDSIHDKKHIAEALYNLGWISCIQKNNYKDDIYLYRSLKISVEIKDTNTMSAVYNALASYYSSKYYDLKQKNDFDSSLRYFTKGIDLGKKTKSKKQLSILYANLGDLFFAGKDFKTAEFYYSDSYELSKNRADSSTLISLTYKTAYCRIEYSNSKKELPKFEFARRFFLRKEHKEYELEFLSLLPQVYYKLGMYKEGFKVYEEYIAKQKEANKQTLATTISNVEDSYSLEKSEANVIQLKKDNEITELKNKKKNYFIFGLIAIGLVVIIIAFLLFKQNKLRQLTNQKLLEQNHIIKEKKEEIDHSIQYAKGIQLAILPDLKDLNDRFKESFVFYKPKDVVSGDFYWFSKVEDDFYCVAADCTGHGVPGALMSIIGTDKITQAVFEKKITSPGEILSFLNVQIKNVLKQHSDASIQKDGMDVAILKFSPDNNFVEYAAANRPLFLLRNKEIIEYKATKTAIAGFTPNNQVFENHKIGLQKNDNIYIFTDGYADQFGGPSGGKKIMTRKLKELLIEVSTLPANEQRARLETAFTDWKGTFEQTDDVLVIGITI